MLALVPNLETHKNNLAIEDGVEFNLAEVISDDDVVNNKEIADRAESIKDMMSPKLNIVVLTQKCASFFLELSEGVTVPSPRQSQWVKSTPKGWSNYTEGEDLDKLVGVDISTSPKERKKKKDASQVQKIIYCLKTARFINGTNV